MRDVCETSGNLYELFVEEAVAYAIVFIGLDGNIHGWNEGAERLFGYSAAEVVGRKARLMFAPEDVEAGVPEREIRTATAEGQADDRRWKVRKDGSRFFADGILFALHENADVCGFAKIIRDATADKRIEEERTESEARLRLVVDGIRDYAIYMIDPDGRIQTWSRGAQRIKGYTAEEVIGRDFGLLYTEDEVRAGTPRRQLETAAERGTYEEDNIHVRKDGSRFLANVVVSAIRDGEGRVRGFVNLTHDITVEKESAEREAFLAEVSRVLAQSIEYDETLRRIAKLVVMRIADWCAVDLFDENGQKLSRFAVEHIDPAKVQLAKELEQKYPAGASDAGIERVVRERNTAFYPDISDAMLSAGTRDPEHLRILRELGLHSAIVTPLIAGDRLLGAITIVTSGERRLTDKDVVLAEELARRAVVAIQNAQLYREAQQANRAKDDFLATVSHELRTPMTAILGWAQLLRRGADPSIVDEAAVAIERSAKAQAQLIDDILDVARIRVGKLRMRLEEANLAAVVEAAVDTVRLVAEAKSIRVLVDNGADEVRIRGDAQRLQQVVWNLLSNAVKFTPSGGMVFVTVRTEKQVARITVRDTGPGIPSEFLPHVFKRFRQAEPPERRGHGGLGLGLSIARHIVDAHGGTIRVDGGGDGRGATFTVELPLLTADAAETARSGRRSSDQLPDLARVSVLVIEDDPDTLHYLSRTLEVAGAEVRVASSVDEALEAFRERAPDVVVSDIAMPDQNGFDFVRAIRASGSQVPILAVTASGVAGDRDRALSGGFDGYLRKPVAPHTLAEAVRGLLEQ